MAGLNFRFRKSFNIIPGILRWTISKRGASLNLNLGIYSKSWGTGGRRTTTVDLPGTSGIFWRKQEKVKEDPNDADEGFAHLLQLLLIWGGFIVGLVRLYASSLGKGCQLSGHPYWLLGGMLLVELGFFWMLWRTWRLFSGILGLPLAILAAYLQWKVYGHLITPHVLCPVK
jgi:hypothetical protein